jgi:hypothetical protein
LQADVTLNSTTIISTSESEGVGSFTIKTFQLGRSATMKKLSAVADQIEMMGGVVRTERGNIAEEFTTSGDGIRQDFIINYRPEGDGKLFLDISFEGSGIETKMKNTGLQSAIEVRLACGRALVYHALRVTDAAGRSLTSSFVKVKNNIVSVSVDDKNASYPVRIDPTITDADWVSIGGQGQGANGSVIALAVDGSSNIYVGGNFTLAGGISAGYIAKWNGSAWSAVGDGMDGVVSALAFDGSGNLYAGGRFALAGEIDASCIARWDGSVWSTLGNGISGGDDPYVSTIAFDGVGNLYAGGQFTTAGGISANYIAKWNGSEWSPLGSGISGSVSTLAIDGSGNLYAGGNFTTAGGVTANYIAQWNGSAWNPLGSGMNSGVSALVVDGSGNLYAGGMFTLAGGIAANNIAKWNGSAWSPLGSGMNGGPICILYALTIDGSGNLYAGGMFTSAGGIATNNIARWNGSAWSPLGSGTSGGEPFSYIHNLVLDGSGNIYAGGEFTEAGGIAASRIAKWNGSAWSPIGNETDGAILALAVDGSGNLYAGGRFTQAGGIAANYVAKWNGSVWSPLGSGMSGGEETNVFALAVDNAGNLYAGGQFTKVGGIDANCIAKWNGSTWSALGSGMSGGGEGISSVTALTIDGLGNLYAGGDFTTAGGVVANNIAKWNGSTWGALGSGINGMVVALAFGGSGNLYAGGWFIAAGGENANNIAKWNGSTWSALGSGMEDGVSALAADGLDNIYAGGFFTLAGGIDANRIARWDGNAWSALGSGTNSTVSALSIDGSGNIYAGGQFTTAGGIAASRIAQWDGSAWSALGSGTNSTVSALSIYGSGNLYAGGEFTIAGAKFSTYVAKCRLNSAPPSTPPAPTNLTATVGKTQVSLTWNKVADTHLMRYRIYGGTSPNPITKIDSTMGGITDTTKTINSLIDGTRYYFRVTAVVNTGNESGYSNEVSAVPGDLIAPSVPQNLTFTSGNTQVLLQWNKVPDTDLMRYRIYRGTSSPANNLIDSTNSIIDTVKVVTGLTNGTTYYFRITAMDSARNESGFSNEVSGPPQFPPPTISDFNPKSGAIGTTVIITGTNFSNTPANNIVFFGAVRAQVVSSSSTSLTVTTPIGATYQSIAVTNMTTGLTAYTNAPFIVTFLGGGNITSTSLAPNVDFTTGTFPLGIAIGDLDGDGKADIVVANNTSSNTISVFRNTSTSRTVSLAAKVDFSTGNNPNSVVIGDVDGDGKLDLVVTNVDDNTISVFRNTSTPGSITTGSFASKVDLTTGDVPYSVALGDIDGDGKPDLVVANVENNTVSVLRNKSTSGSITTGSFASKVDYTTGDVPYSVALGDIDGDSKLDLVVANEENNTVSVLRNTSTYGSITAGSFALKVDFTTSGSPYCIVIGDVDRDDKPDLVITNAGNNTVSVLRNTSTYGSITESSFAEKVDFTTGEGPYSVALGDIDGDGKLDLVVANAENNKVSVLRNTSTYGSITAGSFVSKVDFTTGDLPYSVALGDIDGDGIPDVTVANAGSNTVSVLRNIITSFEAPENLLAIGDYTQATLKWNKVIHTDLKCYYIYRGTSSPASTLIDSTVNGVDTIYKVTGLTSGITYYFRVTAMDSMRNESGFSNEVSVTLWDYAGTFFSITDIPRDQGGQVRIKWQRSLLDSIGSTPQITSYSLMRRIPVGELAKRTSKGELLKGVLLMDHSDAIPKSTSHSLMRKILIGESEMSKSEVKQLEGILSNDTLMYYDYLMNIAALQIRQYNAVVPTLGDSTSSGINMFRFLLIAHTSDPNTYYISREDSGYSVDNLAPLAATGLYATLQSGSSVQLNWNPNTTDHDVGRYDIYRSDTSGFIPNSSLKIGTSGTPAYTDTSFVAADNYYYRIITVDVHGNESGTSNEASVEVPLPVEMTSFTVTTNRWNAELHWKTATEANNYGFELERRGVSSEQSTVNSWIKIGFVAGAGTSNSPHEYSYSDANLPSGRYAYRLKQIDQDGSYKYSESNEIEIGLAPRVLTLAQNYPNPFNPSTIIEFTVPEDGRASLKIYNTIGQLVATVFDGTVQAGYIQKATLNASRLSSGVYFSRLQYNEKSMIKKIVLMK